MTRPTRRALTWTALAALLTGSSAAAQTGLTSAASISSQGQPGDRDSRYPDVSANGRVVAFCGESSTLVPGDTNGLDDVFVRDRVSGTTARISVSTQGAQANARCRYPALSADGRHVSFVSLASTLTPGVPAKGTVNVFLHDRAAGTTVLLSANAAGQSGDAYSTFARISADGAYVVFLSAATNLIPGDGDAVVDIYLRDVVAGTLELVSVSSGGQKANGACHHPDISADGRWLAYSSLATNLVPGDSNGVEDVFVHDRQTGTTLRVSVATGGGQASDTSVKPGLSADGRYVAFTSSAPDLVAGDTNGVADVFVHDLQTGTTRRVSVSTAGAEGDGDCGYAAISNTGRYVAFESLASNLVPGDSNGVEDVFRHDLVTGETILLSQSSLGAAGDGASFWPRLSGDGSVAVLESAATTLFSGDLNQVADAVVRDLSLCPAPAPYCVAKTNSQGCVARIEQLGSLSLSGADDLRVVATSVLNNHPGMLIWGRDGNAVPFQGGTLCVAAPRRTQLLQAGGTPPPTQDCSGTFVAPLSHAYLAGQGLAAGDVLYTQFWSRDTGFAPPDNIGLTGAIHFRLCP